MATLNSLESLPSLPTNLKDIQKYLDIAKEYEAVDLTVTYWCQFYALLKGYTLYEGYEDLRFLHQLDERLLKHKQEFNPLKAIIDHVSARDHVQNVALQHFSWADMGFKFFATKHSVSLIIETLESTETLLDVCSSFWGTNEELAEKKNLAKLNGAVLKTRLSKVTAEINQQNSVDSSCVIGEVTISSPYESLSLTNTLKDNRVGTVNPEGVKRYDRQFLLELRYYPASLKKPQQLPETFCVHCPDDQRNKNEQIISAYPISFEDILKGLTWANIQQRKEQVKALTIDTEERLIEMSQLICKKVLVEKAFYLPLLAKICSALSHRKVASALNPAKTTNFRALLIYQCQKHFDRERHSPVDVVEKKKEIENAETKQVWNKSTIITRFIGELFKYRVVSSNFLNSCMCRLLTRAEIEDEESLDCLCILLSTVGKAVEYRVEMKEFPAISNLENLNIAFNFLESVVTKSGISDYLRSRIEHVIDVRNHDWIFKKQNLKCLDSLRRETSNEEFQPTTESYPGATQDFQFKSYPIREQNICDSPRQQQNVDESLEDGDNVEKDEPMTLAASESAFFPLQDDHLEQDSHPSQTSDIPVCSSSQQSHENSAADPVLESLESPQLTREIYQDVPLGKFTLTNDEIALKSLVLLCTFFTNDKNIEDAVLGVKEWLHPSIVARFINQCLLLVNELGREERRATSTLFKEMVKRNLFNTSDLKEGFTELLQGAEDWMVIFPKLLWESAVELVEPLFEEGVINLKFLPQLSSVLNSPLAADFVAAVLKELVLVQGVAEAERLFIFSNASLISVLPHDVDLIAFRNHHKELEFLSKFDSLPKDSGFARMPNSNPVPTCQVNIDFQCSLEKFLRDANQLTDNEVYTWIQKHNFEVNCDFIRTLTNALFKCSMEEHDSEMNYITFERWTNLLRHYVCNSTDYELEVLFTIQKCSNKQQNFNCIILILLHSGVVSPSSWELWRSMDMLFAATCYRCCTFAEHLSNEVDSAHSAHSSSSVFILFVRQIK
ncbi:eukaryotic translation initiation factor 4G-like isoform X3 [Daphnia pulicaria]|uniref:eukaryotic translation initiation factor 4G-like isoform X3 n=1 Tax=Daphnia pulicaria TaxID=35523 RepID=UPI001EEAE7BA|nr:eukaryotic translation initiation factor 4G-like isoform X3 [Daphnia pulicaria]